MRSPLGQYLFLFVTIKRFSNKCLSAFLNKFLVFKNYIQKYKNEGIKLTNGKDGGKGGRFTEEVKKKMSEIQKGEKIAFVGQIGSGKTTMIKILI